VTLIWYRPAEVNPANDGVTEALLIVSVTGFVTGPPKTLAADPSKATEGDTKRPRKAQLPQCDTERPPENLAPEATLLYTK
jgi:hypothetical protein